ncbi:sushi, von Willebrand factor type A, EGF and pentraxin domain-containing protein 1-like [Cottoperca gobio]|uniref:Sushi, von Willebrand factor type A, EGF and pentraxin domain-containing protein 1-like n=1 Tax=Cottoperca gobio TaxID=56716 RepID=A0A6J2Q215_COTGO|nr:sushi, von Willebrand factor type A, EGF and pentraxin domain-containing protein 1-like [Cottoperca gobio]
MKTVGLNIVILSFALLVSAQVPRKCSAPPKYPHTRLVETTVQKFIRGAKVYYDCAEDFTPFSGNRDVRCNGGKWTTLTLKCEKVSCGNAGDLPNGDFQYEGNSFGEKVNAVCNAGYTLKGPHYMICKKSGWAGEVPSCEAGETTCSTPAVNNSVSSAADVSVYRVGDHMTFTCSQGFQLDGAQRITCGPGGVWQHQPPRCLPSPDATQSPIKETGGCGVPVATDNVNLADKYITKTSFKSGDRVLYVCDVGYTQAGGSRYRSCIKGMWTPLMLKCERKLCGTAGEIINGDFTYTGVEFGDQATAVCNEGHILVGRATRNCLSKGWDGRVPACEAVVCEEPSRVTNAEMQGPQEPPYTYRTVISYHCRVGTLIGKGNIWCTKDGTWSDSPPECKEITCPSPNVPNGYWRKAQRELYRESDVVSIECKRGYAKSSRGTVTCGHDGRWSPRLPKCIPQHRRRN